MNFFKKVLKKSVKANVYLFGGKGVKDVVKGGVGVYNNFAKKNPEVGQAVTTAVGASTGTGPFLGTALSYFGGGGFGGAQVYDPPSVSAPADPGLVPGFDNQTLVLAGAALVAVVLLTRK